jgi:hypothetical protein
MRGQVASAEGLVQVIHEVRANMSAHQWRDTDAHAGHPLPATRRDAAAALSRLDLALSLSLSLLHLELASSDLPPSPSP